MGVSIHTTLLFKVVVLKAKTPAKNLNAWPPLPYAFDTGYQLYLSITQLGSIEQQYKETLSAMDKICENIKAQGDPFDVLPRAYVHSSGLIYAFFGSEPAAVIRRSQAVQVISAVRSYSAEYGTREILVADIISIDRPIATFALRFDEAGSQPS